VLTKFLQSIKNGLLRKRWIIDGQTEVTECLQSGLNNSIGQAMDERGINNIDGHSDTYRLSMSNSILG